MFRSAKKSRSQSVPTPFPVNPNYNPNTLQAQSASASSLPSSSSSSPLKKSLSGNVGDGKRGRPLSNSSIQVLARIRKALPRSASLPASLDGAHVKGIMKICTADDSLHSKYGECKESENNHRRNGGGKNRSKSHGHIQFKDLLIREYARTVGDNPSCSSGPPISIAWDYDPETKVISVDKYENLRPPRRSHFEMILPREVRHEILRHEWDVSQAQIASAIRNNIRIKNQRRSTVNNLGKAERMEEFFESASCKLKQGLLFQKSTKQQAMELDAMFQKASRLRRMSQMDNLAGAVANDFGGDVGCGSGGGGGNDDQEASESFSPHDRHHYVVQPDTTTTDDPSSEVDESMVGLDLDRNSEEDGGGGGSSDGGIKNDNNSTDSTPAPWSSGSGTVPVKNENDENSSSNCIPKTTEKTDGIESSSSRSVVEATSTVPTSSAKSAAIVQRGARCDDARFDDDLSGAEVSV